MTVGSVIVRWNQKNRSLLAVIAGSAVASGAVFGLRPALSRVPSASAFFSSRNDALHGPMVAIDLGTVEAGGRAEARFSITNDCASSVQIASIWTSCPCLSVELADRWIAPCQTVEVTV
jgi:hypothetical protein